MEALRYKPSAYWNLDGTSPFTDYSGYATTATRTGTEQKGIGLVSNASFSQILDSTHTILFPSQAYVAGKEWRAFSIMASIFPVERTSVGDQRILSNNGKFDGLSINGTVVSFSTKYLTTGEARCSFDLGTYRRADIVGVHTKFKNSLYVNGKLVSEVDISALQQTDTYDAPDNNLYAGGTTSTQALMLNAVAIFGRALTPEEVLFVYQSLNKRFAGSVPRSASGDELLVSTTFRTPFLDINMDQAQWNLGIMKNVSTEGTTMLIPDEYNGVSVQGSWERSFDFYTAGTPTTITSLNIQWIGKGATVTVSIDGGTTWLAVTSAVNISAFNSLDPTNKNLMVRVAFADSVADAYIDEFQINGYNSTVVTPISGRPVTFTSAVNFDEHPPMELRADWGARLYTGTILWGIDNGEEVFQARTIEVWMKKNSTTTPTYSFTPTTTYVNGISGATAGRGEWAVYHFVLPANVTTFSITGDATIGRAAIYDTALSASAIALQYTNYVGSEKITEAGVGTIAMTESATPATIYAHDWSIQSA